MLKRRTLILLGAGLLLLVVVGYPAGAWFVGKRVETAMGEQYRALHDYAPFVTVSDRKYERGIFSSVETLTVNLALMPTGTAPMPAGAGAPVRFTVTSRIKHLPLPSLFILDSATVDSTLAFADGSVADVVEWTGGQDLARIHTAIKFSGGGSTTVAIPAFNTARLSSDEATLKMEFSRDLADYSMQGNAPRFAIMDKTGGRVQISGVQISGDHQRIFPDVPSLYRGSDHFSAEQITVNVPGMPAEAGSIKKLSVDMTASAAADREFVDVAAKIGVGSINIVGQDYGPAQFDTSFNHLHARTIAKLSQTDWNSFETNAVLSTKDIDALIKEVDALFVHSPELKIDRLSFTLPEGETVVSALFKVSDPKPGDFSKPLALIGKAYVGVDFKAPEKFLAGLFQGTFAGALQQGGGYDKELTRMIAEGYVSREGGFIKTRFEFRDAKPWLNGKQYVQPSAAMARAPAGPARHPVRKFRSH